MMNRDTTPEDHLHIDFMFFIDTESSSALGYGGKRMLNYYGLKY